MDLKALQLAFANSQSEKDLETICEFEGISREQFFNIATDRGWTPGPIAMQMLVSDNSGTEADAEYIDNINKASVMRLHVMLELAITRIEVMSMELSPPALIDSLDTLVKIREKLSKLHMPMYGLTTAEPVRVQNPINIFTTSEDNVEIPGEDS